MNGVKTKVMNEVIMVVKVTCAICTCALYMPG